MRIVKVIFLAALVYGGIQLKNRLQEPTAPAITFADVAGKTRDFRNLDRPMVAGFWIENCSYSAKAMAVLQSVRQGNPAGDLDVVGFFLNAKSGAEVAHAGALEGYRVTLAPCQPPVELIAALAPAFRIRGPGRDLYVLDRRGHYHVVSMVDGNGNSRPKAEVQDEVSGLVADVLKKG